MSTNHTDRLVRMANQIAIFFRSYPQEEAVAGVAQHLRAYWTPKMLRALTAYASGAGDKLDPLVLEAIGSGTSQAESPIRPATHDPQLAGEGASDAG